MYLHIENEVAMLRHSKLLIADDMCIANEKNTKIPLKVIGQGQMSPTFNHFLAFPMGHIPTKLHQFPTSSFQDFVRTGTQTLPKTIPARSMRAGKHVLNSGITVENNQTCASMQTSEILTE